MTSRYESAIDKAIREAEARGEFKNLPGAGKPLPNHNELTDEDWWLKSFIQRENLTGLLPSTLALRKELDNLDESLRRLAEEDRVRSLVADLNTRVEKARRGVLDGPPVNVAPLDVDEVVSRWQTVRSSR
ncbi:uncharacterized protein DUF1992 [Stackebrandtia endophytica]|uniref:Uncharacterized protein DUF1992 n=1 Tax=Stackebrandtia endophytica TaxID=1496996 RepID=A0A543B1R5_9ACTN|nr:DUF1992 domain-containing protein [Stackebrandtia endophytica]TQL78761.1 uncharacterized protein DUF1992 [Stackebrandtia endophytica]